MIVLSRRRLLALGACLAGCEERPRPAGGGHRVVSLSPSTTEAVFAIGAGSRLVGRSKFCDFPPEVARIPAVGGFVDPSFEAIIGLAPDLVIGVQGPSGRDLADRLADRGIGTFFPPTDSFAQITAMLKSLGTRLGHAEGARAAANRITRDQKTVEDALTGRHRPKAILVFGLRPIVVAGPGGFADEMLRRAGAVNSVQGRRFPTLGIERVSALAPEGIIDATGAALHDSRAGIRREDPGWKELKAVQKDKIVRLRDERVLRPGPRVGEGLKLLARALHPDAAIPK